MSDLTFERKRLLDLLISRKRLVQQQLLLEREFVEATLIGNGDFGEKLRLEFWLDQLKLFRIAAKSLTSDGQSSDRNQLTGEYASKLSNALENLERAKSIQTYLKNSDEDISSSCDVDQDVCAFISSEDEQFKFSELRSHASAILANFPIKIKNHITTTKQLHETASIAAAQEESRSHASSNKQNVLTERFARHSKSECADFGKTMAGVLGRNVAQIMNNCDNMVQISAKSSNRDNNRDVAGKSHGKRDCGSGSGTRDTARGSKDHEDEECVDARSRHIMAMCQGIEEDLEQKLRATSQLMMASELRRLDRLQEHCNNVVDEHVHDDVVQQARLHFGV